MAEDWASDVKKYAPDADDGVIAAIVRYCGIALRSRDASLVSFTDPEETDRVRENFCKKKLALTEPDSVLDAAIASVGEKMSGDPTRNRVTVYYLLAAHFDKLGLFGASDDVAPVAAPMGIMAAPTVTKSSDDSRRGAAATGWGDYVPLAILVVGGIGLLSYLSKPAPVSVAAPVVAVAAPAVPAIPEGAGLVSSEVDGAPFVSVYFDTAKTDVAPEIAAAAAGIKAYLDSHAGTGLAVSGYNDPRGDAAMNAELSKNRAIAVGSALVAAGIPEAAIDLVKPEATTDTTTTLTNARRVDIRVVTLTGAPVAVTTSDAVAAPTGQ
jgi:outer membrane protein OmpA-like peptidoglycan-associated protein